MKARYSFTDATEEGVEIHVEGITDEEGPPGVLLTLIGECGGVKSVNENAYTLTIGEALLLKRALELAVLVAEEEA